MFDAHSNYGLSTVASAPSPATTATSLVVADASTFPAVPFNCTVFPPDVAPTFDNSEIVRVTAILGTIFTIIRAQEGTNAKSIADGWQIANTTTVKVFTDIEAAITSGAASWGNISGTLTNQTDLVAALAVAASTADWGGISGTLSNQTDLQAALDAKLAKASNLSDVASAATSFDNIKQAATTAATGVVELATVAEAGLGTDTTRAVTSEGLYPPYDTVASAATTNIGAANSSRVIVTGTTTITAFDTAPEGIVRNILFTGILTLTHNGINLILPGGANITTADGDCCTAVSKGLGAWRVTIYQKADGTAIAGGSAVWGAITGTLSSQTDLQSALDAKQPILSQSALTYAGTTNIDLTGADYQTLTLAGDVTFTTSNKAAARSKTVIITCDATPRTFTFPSWVWVGAGAPTGIAASKKGVLSLTCLGSNDTDIIAVYSVQNP